MQMLERPKNTPSSCPDSDSLLLHERGWQYVINQFRLSFQAYVDKAFNREILELDVKCNNHEWGCKWEGEFQNAKVSKKNATNSVCIVTWLFLLQRLERFFWWRESAKRYDCRRRATSTLPLHSSRSAAFYNESYEPLLLREEVTWQWLTFFSCSLGTPRWMWVCGHAVFLWVRSQISEEVFREACWQRLSQKDHHLSILRRPTSQGR